MADYNKLTVVQIRELFKSKNIPTTGLTRKAQLIERLLEEDAREAEARVATEPAQSVDNAEPPAPGDGDVPPSELVDLPSEPAAQEAEDAATPSLPSTTEPIVAEAATDAQVASQVGTAAHDIGEGIANAPLHMPMPTEEESKSTSMTVQEQRPPSASASTTASPAPEENRKRKRRSATPSVSEEEIAQKRAKQEQDGAAIILKEDLVAHTGSQDETNDAAELKDDPEWTMVEHPMEEKVASADPSIPLLKSDGARPDAQSAEQLTKGLSLTDADDGKTAEATPGSPLVPTKLPPGRENRYKDLVSGRAEPGPQTEMEGSAGIVEDREERDISPALHPATSALYIRDFMRPLRPDALEAHLVSLAHPPRKQGQGEEETSAGIIQSFHLDAIRTHCFAVFASVSAAARVRSALHDRVWPAEGNRKPLWADFVPEDKVQGWIDTETSSGSGGRGAGQKRWEVCYERLDDGTMTTRLQEASGAPLGPRWPTMQASNTGTGLGANVPAPQIRTESGSSSKAKTAPQAASFVALDSLFKSTTAKPKLYYMPVSKQLANKRLDQLEALTTRNNLIPPGGSGYADSRRYTFENDDMLVDNGPEFGLRQRGPAPRPGYRRR